MTKDKPRLGDLLLDPSETLDVEIKEWLDLTDHNHRALLAKEVIALANHGGGFLLIGFEELEDGSFAPASGRPANLASWSQDAVQSIIAKYVDPLVQCRVVHEAALGNPDRYPIIAVPGGHRVPVRAKSGSPDGKLVPHRVYTRRPGPSSEEPRTADEWDRVFERILQNRKAELLDAMRAIMAGEIPVASATEHSPTRHDELRAFEKAAVARWEGRVQSLPLDATPRFPLGSYDVTIAIDGDFTKPSLAELKHIVETAVRNHSGWPPFVSLTRPPFTPKSIDGAIEFWRGPEPDGSLEGPAHHDFWRASPDGLFFHRTGYREDSREGLPPGGYFHLTTATWRIGETILEGFYLAKALQADNANLIIDCAWRGLAGRKLTAFGTNRQLYERYTAEQDTYLASAVVALDALPAALPEVVHLLLAPLYELFDFFQLPKRLVEEELAALQRNTF